jgi:membrane protein YqaA with SNARE-associated domain
MSRIVAWVRSVALALGVPGLFIVAALDSSFLPLPGATDLFLIIVVTRDPDKMLLAAAAATLGSVCGCLAMHYVGRKGGDVLVRRRFAKERIERATASLRRHGVIAILIPSLLPPPAPFKIFMLLSGVIGIPASRLATAIVIGRSIRYLTVGTLAVRYGTQAQTFLRERGAIVSLAAVAVLTLGFFAYLQWKKRRLAKADRMSGLARPDA